MSDDQLVNPMQIPVFTGDFGELERASADLKAQAGKFRDAGGSVHSEFQGLASCYHAPEADQLFATTAPVKTKSDHFAGDLEKVSAALDTYVSEAKPIAARLQTLRDQAFAFVESVRGDDDWRKDQKNIDRNNGIDTGVKAAWAEFMDAERACASKIRALVGLSELVTDDGSHQSNMYGYSLDSLKEAEEMPWGKRAEREYEGVEWLWHKTVDFGKGFFVDGVWGTVRGLGTLVGVDGWDKAGQAWTGLGKLATGLAITATPAAGIFWTARDDQLPSWLRDSRKAVKETGKALVAYDEWGKNPARAAGSVTFNVLTTVFSGGAGTAAKAGAVGKVLSVTGKVARAVDATTYVSKFGKFGVAKVGDLMGTLKDLPFNVRLGANLHTGNTFKMPERFPEEHFVQGWDRHGSPTFMDKRTGDLYHENGDLYQAVKHAEKEAPAGERVPNEHELDAGRKLAAKEEQKVLVGVRSGTDVKASVGGTADHLSGGSAAERVPPGGSAGRGSGASSGHAPGNSPDHGTGGGVDRVPRGSADGHVRRGTAGHEPLGGPRHSESSHGEYGPDRNLHTVDGAHQADQARSAHPGDSGHDHAPHGAEPDHGFGDADRPASHDDGHAPAAAESHESGHGGPAPEGVPLEPQPDWHGSSADKMRHHRRPAVDVSRLSHEEKVSVLETEAQHLADDAVNAPKGEAAPGDHYLESGCAGSFLHDNVISVHSSTTKLHGQTLPHTHPVLRDILQQIQEDVDRGVLEKKGRGHGKCAEISLISDRLRQLDPTGSTIRTVDDARRVLEGSVMHTRRIGDVIHKRTGEVGGRHGDFFPPCDTCKHVLPQLGIHVHK
ncbi:YwqJ-related putative deaminase [Streptomyces gamaensis]|uniref:YwqJ-related putative deaminase n=1 Tax=Streptomyces gamaensis TaxID=1763542 RepID=A0ABW0YYP4_9ACTN